MTTSSSMPGESSVPQQPPEAVSGSRPNHRDWAFAGLALATLTLLLTLLGLGVMGFFHLENRIDTRFDRLDSKIDARFGQLQDLILSLHQARQAPAIE